MIVVFSDHTYLLFGIHKSGLSTLTTEFVQTKNIRTEYDHEVSNFKELRDYSRMICDKNKINRTEQKFYYTSTIVDPGKMS